MKPPIVKPLQSHFPVTSGDDTANENQKAALTSLCFVTEPTNDLNENDDTDTDTDDDDDELLFRTSQCHVRNSNVQSQLNVKTCENMIILSSHADGSVYEWDFNANSSKLWFHSPAAGMKLQNLPKIQSLLYHTRDGNIKIYDVATKKAVYHLNHDVATIGFCSAIASKNSNNMIAFLKQQNDHNSIQLVDWKSQTQSLSLPLHSKNTDYPNMCMCLSFVEQKTDDQSSDLPIMISAGMEDGTVYIYDIRHPSKPFLTQQQCQLQTAPPKPYLQMKTSVTCMDIIQNNVSVDSAHQGWTGIIGMAPSPTLNSANIETSSSTVATFHLDPDCPSNMQNDDEKIGRSSRLSSKYISTRIPYEKMGINACQLISHRLCLLAGWDGRVRCFQINPSKDYELIPHGYIYPHYYTSVTCMDYAAKPNILATGTKEGSVTLWPGPPPLL